MTTKELIHAYQSAVRNNPNIFGIPGGALKPAEAAGELLQLYGHKSALETASRLCGNNTSPWSFSYQVYRILANATP